MAIVTRYFSTSSAGAADGTSWANRAALLSGGVWSTIITGFSFAGADSLLCYIGPGTYTVTTAPSQFASTAANPIILHGCDGSGNALTPPDPTWQSAQAAWDDSSLPVIATTTNIVAITNFTFGVLRLLKFTGSGRGGTLLTTNGNCAVDWCSFANSTSNSSASCVTVATVQSRLINCVLAVSGTSYNAVIVANAGTFTKNTRVVGNASATTGNRQGININSAVAHLFDRTTILNNVGDGIFCTTSTSRQLSVTRCTLIGNTNGISGSPSGTQTTNISVQQCMITGNTYGIYADVTPVMATGNRLRNNATANFQGMANYPDNMGNDVSSGTDADEYVDAGSGDYRIKSSSTYWGKGYGAGDYMVAGGVRMVNINGGADQ